MQLIDVKFIVKSYVEGKVIVKEDKVDAMIDIEEVLLMPLFVILFFVLVLCKLKFQ